MPDENIENTLYNIVNDNMVHTCSKNVNGRLNDNGNCIRNYDKKVICSTTCIDCNGYPQYKRRKKDDLKIVHTLSQANASRLEWSLKCRILRDAFKQCSTIFIQISL